MTPEEVRGCLEYLRSLEAIFIRAEIATPPSITIKVEGLEKLLRGGLK